MKVKNGMEKEEKEIMKVNSFLEKRAEKEKNIWIIL